MKNKIFAILLFVFASGHIFAQKYYDDQWKKVAENYKTGKYKSNLPLILEIQNQAMKDDNAVQLIRSLKAEFSIVNQTRDDTKNDASSQFFTKLKGLDSKLKGDDQANSSAIITPKISGESIRERTRTLKILQRSKPGRNSILKII